MVVGVMAALLALGCGGTDDGDAEPTPPEAPDESAPFDPERSRELAEGYLGVAEENIEETPLVRIVRRGDEQLPVTMDLREGRLNLELDAADDDVFRVTRVMVETAEGEDIVVE